MKYSISAISLPSSTRAATYWVPERDRDAELEQWQIEALRRLEITEQIRKQYGFAPSRAARPN